MKKYFIVFFIPLAMMTAVAFADEVSEAKGSQSGSIENPSVKTVGLTLGPTNFSFQDTSGMDHWSPVILQGAGASLDVFYGWEAPNKSRRLGLNFQSIGDFSYDIGARKFQLPAGNRYTAVGLDYGLAFYLFRNVLFKNLDLGIGPRVRLGYMNYKRLFLPDIVKRLEETAADVSFVLSARFHPDRRLRLEGGFSGGFIVGFSRQTHSVSGSTPLDFAGGWQIGFSFGAGLSLGPRFELGLTCQNQARGVYLGSPYRLNLNRIFLSLNYSLRKS